MSFQKYVIITILFLYLITSVTSVQTLVHHLQPGSKLNFTPFSNKLEVFCYAGKPKYVVNLWQTISLKINTDSQTNDYEIYEGSTREEVLSEYEEKHSKWSFNMFSSKPKAVKIDPFLPSCVGIETATPYHVELHMIRVDYWKVLMLIAGVLLFLSAGKLSENSLFYYICGVSFGICASFLILIYFVSKLFPKKPMMYGFVIGGWTIGVYLLQLILENVRTIFVTYQTYLMYYVLATGFISFVICYRLGPPTNPRSKNLIRWSLMGAALLTIFHSSHFHEATMGFIVILVISYNIPKLWIAKSRTFWKRKFPPKSKLLSNEEYYEQGAKETVKALDELREFCSSPQCNQWKTVLKLKDAKRFASFIEGEHHLSDDEILEYENDQSVRRSDCEYDGELTDDSTSSIEL
ncbi:nuclear envelope integral membrane protein 1 isoform X2 [Chrysoperla carnea]|uniref:nuclear envelope integral membrane protein 1 isoform X2 n=1 Tax=Chrysoperla carnea TaxID=189513 RepID=UPI001D098C66|nr:nuclear envelope integral membrane protein 1 isoform X2 [Chrysoperla carnea]